MLFGIRHATYGGTIFGSSYTAVKSVFCLKPGVLRGSGSSSAAAERFFDESLCDLQQVVRFMYVKTRGIVKKGHRRLA